MSSATEVVHCEMCDMFSDEGLPATTRRWWHQAFATTACRYVDLCDECAENTGPPEGEEDEECPYPFGCPD